MRYSAVVRSTVTRAAALCAVATAFACGGSTGSTGNDGGTQSVVEGGAGTPCTLNSDCSGNFVCIDRICNEQCAADRDCPSGQRCIADVAGNQCRLASESLCSSSSDCIVPATCASDGQCRVGCSADRDCLANQICSADRVCIDG